MLASAGGSAACPLRMARNSVTSVSTLSGKASCSSRPSHIFTSVNGGTNDESCSDFKTSSTSELPKLAAKPTRSSKARRRNHDSSCDPEIFTPEPELVGVSTPLRSLLSGPILSCCAAWMPAAADATGDETDSASWAGSVVEPAEGSPTATVEVASAASCCTSCEASDPDAGKPKPGGGANVRPSPEVSDSFGCEGLLTIASGAAAEASAGGGGGGGGGGGKGGAGNSGGGRGGAGGKSGGRGSSEMTFEEYQAMQKEKKAQQKKEQEEKAKQRAAAAAKAFEEEAAGGPPPPKAEPAVVEEKQSAPPPPAQEAEDDWEAQAEEEAEVKAEEPPAPEPAPAPAAETKPAAPEPAPKAPEPAPKPKEPEAPAKVEEPAEAEEEEEIVEEEEAKPVKAEGGLKEPDSRRHLNVVFIGHVDAGKSTTCGNVLYLCNCVDERTIEKYQKEAKDKNRESWFLAYIMDTNEEEKAKGKTVEVGRAHFETENRRFTILDAPGHKSYVPNMIAGASQADIGVLIISARKGEFETGFERGGQTTEHTLLAKTLGVEKLVIAVNKMDDPSVQWAQERYDEIVGKLKPFMKQSGFKEDQAIFLPISGLTGDNIKEKKNTPSWFKEKSLLDLLDSLDTEPRNKNAPFRIPMLDGYKDMGSTMALGKVEQGMIKPGSKCIIQPTSVKCTVQSVFIQEEEMQYAAGGENVVLKVTGCGEDDLKKGYVLCPIAEPIRALTKFKAQLQVLELPEERPVLTAGYRAVMHVHVAIEECEILKLYESRTKKDMKKVEKNPKFVREGSILTCSIAMARATALDLFTGCQQLGRFTLRDEGRTIAIGKITELPKPEADSKPGK
mmetsp:Transcript_69598/g.166983  ORF Transcript_69598/g.166983 Transcript_69598/m.166983 type:complete len:842 (+) Transcript_69598:248-2773(+)